MRNITLSLTEDVLNASRQYAKKHHTSLNALIRKLLINTVMTPTDHPWIDETFQLMKKSKVTSHGKKWKREDLYDV